MDTTDNRIVATIIIPTYNRAQFISRAVQSALDQTIKNIEVIVVDDGSTDNSSEVLNNIKDKRLKYIKLAENMGAPAARNVGIKNAKGEYIAFLDSDDEILPSKLEKQLDLISKVNDEYTIVYSSYNIINYKTNQIIKEFTAKSEGNIYNKLLENNCIGSPTPLIHRHCFTKCGVFDETLESCQDWDMWIRLSKYYSFRFIPECLANVFIHGNQISTSIAKKISARKILLSKYEDDLSKNKSILSWHLRRLGSYLCIDGQKSEGRNLILKSIRVNPTNWRGYVHLLLSLIYTNIYKKIMKSTSTKTGDIQLYS